MPFWLRRMLRRTLVIAVLPVISAGCTSNDTTSSLVDLTASTAGGLVQIFVKAYLDHTLARNAEPDLSAPISEQQH